MLKAHGLQLTNTLFPLLPHFDQSSHDLWKPFCLLIPKVLFSFQRDIFLICENSIISLIHVLKCNVNVESSIWIK